MLGRAVIRNGYHAWMMGIAMVALDTRRNWRPTTS
jgi:hypothetical protein